MNTTACIKKVFIRRQYLSMMIVGLLSTLMFLTTVRRIYAAEINNNGRNTDELAEDKEKKLTNNV